MKCPICGDGDEDKSQLFQWNKINCLRCGEFRINADVIRKLEDGLKGNDRKVANASGWIREHQNEAIDSTMVDRLLHLPTPSFEERKRKFLKWLEINSKGLGDSFDIEEETIRKPLHSATYSVDFLELDFLKNAVHAEGLIYYIGKSENRIGDPRVIILSAKGYDFLSQLNKNIESQIGFCAMWFDKSVNSIWDKAIEPAMKDAGYEPLRIDKKDHANRIDDELFADIRRSRFIVADFTHGESGVRGGVYFEAGFAQGLGLPVIWTCREDMLTENKLHFDIRQYNFLGWSENNLDDFKDRLQKRIEAILGRGTWKQGT